MMPTAVIIAMAVESAPTRTEVRRKEAARLREASSASIPRSMPRRLEGPAVRASMNRGMARANGRKAAKRKPDQRSCNAEAGRFADECGENDTLAGAEGAHDSNLRTAPNDRNGNRVVNKESANNERNVAQEPQVPTEGRQHTAILIGARALWTNFDSSRKRGLQTLLPFFRAGSLRHFQEDAIDAAVARQSMLSGCEIHHNSGFVAVRIRVDASHHVTVNFIVDKQLDSVAGSVPQARTHPNAVGISQILKRMFRNILRLKRNSLLRFTLRESAAFGDEIQPNER